MVLPFSIIGFDDLPYHAGFNRRVLLRYHGVNITFSLDFQILQEPLAASTAWGEDVRLFSRGTRVGNAGGAMTLIVQFDAPREQSSAVTATVAADLEIIVLRQAWNPEDGPPVTIADDDILWSERSTVTQEIRAPYDRAQRAHPGQ